MKKILSKCKCGVFLSCNEHRNYYQSVREWILENMAQDEIKEIPEDVLDKMIETDTAFVLQFYPTAPIGFHILYHYDYDELIKQAHNLLEIK